MPGNSGGAPRELKATSVRVQALSISQMIEPGARGFFCNTACEM
jgi:hypothetical protein